MNYRTLQSQYDKIYSYFKNTTEPFDFLEWNGTVLQVWQNGIMIEMYCAKDLKKLLI